MLLRRCLVILGLLLCLVTSQGLAEDLPQVPVLKQRVTDLTGTLSRTQQSYLEQQLASLEQDNGKQLFVLLVPSVKPDTIENYATRVFEVWKIGRKDLDNGVLLIIAKQDHRIRIEVGYGLEGVIPDVLAGRIIKQVIVPELQQGNFYQGIEKGVTSLMQLMSRAKPVVQSEQSESADSEDLLMEWGGKIFGLVMASLFAFQFALARVFVVAPLLMAAIFFFMFGGYIAPVIGFILGIVITIVAQLPWFQQAMMPSMTRRRNPRNDDFDDFSGGGFGGGGFGGGFGGGGFGGGGGRSGGGGASGGW